MSMGAGNSSCGQWTAARADRVAVAYERWALGFLSGAGFIGKRSSIDPLAGVDAAGVLAWIDNYCHAHPPEDIERATAEFVYAHPQ